jgi:membrane protease subunit HflC
MKRNPITLITAGMLLVIVTCMLFTFQVRQTQVAVVTTFGKYSRSITEPGLKGRFPWPIQKIYLFDNRLQTFERKLDEVITRDQINLLVAVYVGWRIADPKVFLESFNGDMAKAEQTLEQVVRNAKNGVIGQHNFSDLISTNAAELKFDEVEKQMLNAVQARAERTYGIEVRTLGIKKLNLPDSITSTVFERMKAERQQLITLYQSEGDARAQIIKAAADAKARDIETAANAEKTRILGEAEKKAAEYYAEFEKNPALAVFLFQLKALEPALKDRAYLVLGPHIPPFNLLNTATNNPDTLPHK